MFVALKRIPPSCLLPDLIDVDPSSFFVEDSIDQIRWLTPELCGGRVNGLSRFCSASSPIRPGTAEAQCSFRDP